MKEIGLIFSFIFGCSCLLLMYRLHKRAGLDIIPRFIITKESIKKQWKDNFIQLDNYEKKLAICIIVSFILGAIFFALSIE